MKQIIASVFFTYYLILLGIYFRVPKNFEFNLIIIIARVYNLLLAEVNFRSCFFFFCRF